MSRGISRDPVQCQSYMWSFRWRNARVSHSLTVRTVLRLHSSSSQSLSSFSTDTILLGHLVMPSSGRVSGAGRNFIWNRGSRGSVGLSTQHGVAVTHLTIPDGSSLVLHRLSNTWRLFKILSVICWLVNFKSDLVLLRALKSGHFATAFSLTCLITSCMWTARGRSRMMHLRRSRMFFTNSSVSLGTSCSHFMST